jgi:heme/copper-type cytochrome/quinol oxidase subunit 2
MCDICSSSGFLSCETFGVWFYVIIGGIVLIVAGIVAGIVFKIRKNRKIEMDLSEPLTNDSRYEYTSKSNE